jgi:hypothetical protein
MAGVWVRRGPVFALGALVAALGIAGLTATAQVGSPNERVVEPQRNVLDTDDVQDKESKVWVLHFKFKDPRIIKVNIPGRGQRVVWYLWYQVINMTSKPQTFYPAFELKANDLNMVYPDEISPTAEEAIRAYEDPRNLLKIKDSVSMSSEPIPPSRPDALPTAVTGVAIWMDPNEPIKGDSPEVLKEKAKLPKLAETNNFTIYVAGLSNGLVRTDGPDGQLVTRRKMLQLNFFRAGDRYSLRSEQIRFVPPYQWIYRGSSLRDVPGG